jgi:large subunit ribosomal protein L21
MFAVIKTGGKQYIVKPGDKIKVEKLDTPQDKEAVFSDVMLVAGDKPEESLVGTPFVKGYEVRGKVLAQGRGEKIIVYKYKSKKRYHKKQGHRQAYTEVEILEICGGEGKVGARKASTAKSTNDPEKKVSSPEKRAKKKESK